MGKWSLSIRAYSLLAGVAILVFIADQVTKDLAVAYLAPNRVISVIPGFLDLVSVRNRGAAFGFLNRADIEWQFWLFFIATLIAIYAIFVLARRGKSSLLLMTALGLILGGATGNLIDRIQYGAVIDFLDFYFGSWHWPAFNIADTGICIGVFLACISTWRTSEPIQEQ